MSNGWSRSFWNMRSFVGNAMGGLRGGTNLASWAVAGSLAYFLWVKPARELKKEQEVGSSPVPEGLLLLPTGTSSSLLIQDRAALAAALDPYRYVEKIKPIPDPQETGLIYGKRSETKKPDIS